MRKKNSNKDPLEEIGRLLESNGEGLLKRKIKYQVVNGEITGRRTEEIGEDDNGEIAISEAEEFILDDNGYPIDHRGTALATECGCIVGIRFLRVCPGCRMPLCRIHQGILNGISFCPACFKVLKKELKKAERREMRERRKGRDKWRKST